MGSLHVAMVWGQSPKAGVRLGRGCSGEAGGPVWRKELEVFERGNSSVDRKSAVPRL